MKPKYEYDTCDNDVLKFATDVSVTHATNYIYICNVTNTRHKMLSLAHFFLLMKILSTWFWRHLVDRRHIFRRHQWRDLNFANFVITLWPFCGVDVTAVYTF